MRNGRFFPLTTNPKGDRMSKSTHPAPPVGLKRAGKKLWRDTHKALDQGLAFDDRERSILNLAASQADDLADLERAIESGGTMVDGSTGQPVLNPAIPEARQARAAIARLLGSLDLSDPDEKPNTAASRRASKAAESRWARQAEVRSLRTRRHG